MLQEELEKIFERFFGTGTEHPGGESVFLFPESDMYETENSLVITFEIPGVDAKSVKVFTTEQSVIVEGVKRNDELPEEERRFLRAERNFGRFRRVIEIPVACNMRDARATLKNGVLKVELNKIKEQRKKIYQIPVKEEE